MWPSGVAVLYLCHCRCSRTLSESAEADGGAPLCCRGPAGKSIETGSLLCSGRDTEEVHDIFAGRGAHHCVSGGGIEWCPRSKRRRNPRSWQRRRRREQIALVKRSRPRLWRDHPGEEGARTPLNAAGETEPRNCSEHGTAVLCDVRSVQRLPMKQKALQEKHGKQ